MKTYIKKDHRGYYVEFLEEIDAEYWAGMIGESIEDFYNNKWVLLSDEQVAFHNEHPHASIREVWNMELTTAPERTIEQAKQEKIWEIERYDTSDNVNSFNVITNDGEISYWFTPAERSNYRSSIDAAELIGLQELSFYIGEHALTLPTATAKLMLAQIQLYADQCYMITKQHKAAVEALQTIEEVDNFDVTSGYPEKLQLSLI